MTDFTDAAEWDGAVYPVDATDTGSWDNLEPLITPEQLRGRILPGIPLVSAMRDPVTGKVVVLTDEGIKEQIVSAVAEAQHLSHMVIAPMTIKERHPFIRTEFEEFGYFQIRQKPVYSIISLKIEASDKTNFFTVPPNWIETGNMRKGRLNILPLAPANAAFTFISIASGGPAGLMFLQHLSRIGFIPAYWSIETAVGFKNMSLPRVVNDLIGLTAAINILVPLSATFAKNSVSLGIDAMSQSVSGPGPQQYVTLIQQLQARRDVLAKKLKVQSGQSIYVDNV